MVDSFLEDFEKLEQAVRADVDRRKNPNNCQTSNAPQKTHTGTPKANLSQNNKYEIRFNNNSNGSPCKRTQAINNKKKGKCKYCGIFGHWRDECRIRIGDKERGKRFRLRSSHNVRGSRNN